MTDVNATITATERRGRELAQRAFGEAGEQWLIDAADDPDGLALIAAARAAERFGAATTLRLAAPPNPSPAWAALIGGALKLGGRIAPGKRAGGLTVRRRSGRVIRAAAAPDADAAWRVTLADSGPWVREAGAGDAPMTCAQCREVDRRAIGDYGVPGICLMENAAVGSVAVAADMLGEVRGKKVLIAAGGGNNGGDGLAMARGLAGLGVEVSVALFKPPENLTGDAGVNMRLLRAAGGVDIRPLHADASAFPGLLNGADLIVDALLGTGFRGELSALFREAIEAINRAGRPALALDIPSGMDGDSGRVAQDAVRAERTVTFAAVKTGLLAPPAAAYCGTLYLADIGAPKECLA